MDHLVSHRLCCIYLSLVINYAVFTNWLFINYALFTTPLVISYTAGFTNLLVKAKLYLPSCWITVLYLPFCVCDQLCCVYHFVSDLHPYTVLSTLLLINNTVFSTLFMINYTTFFYLVNDQHYTVFTTLLLQLYGVYVPPRS